METECINLSLLDEYERGNVLRRAGAVIREGGLIAFPTETVYGLGADAMNAEAAARIYAAKGRPSDNPLIAHIAGMDQVDLLARDVPEEAWKVMEAFWPGPLTVILRKKPEVPDGTTGGLPTVAIRMPSHPVAAELIRASERVIAAPSANLSGRPSPTMAAHVLQDMKGRIPMILDGGPVEIGIESTIVDMTEEQPMILRPGYIQPEELSRVSGRQITTDPAVASRRMQPDIRAKAPGMKYRHYAPRGRLLLVEGPADAVIASINDYSERDRAEGHRVGVIASEETARHYRADVVREAGSRTDPDTVAAGLYRILREMDDLACDRIYSESFSDGKLGEAVMNRLIKAAGYQVVEAGETQEVRDS